jgi:hypothetical protein
MELMERTEAKKGKRVVFVGGESLKRRDKVSSCQLFSESLRIA